MIEVTTERIAYGGDAVARHNGLAVFIPMAAPGERLRVRVTERKKRFARAVIEEILSPSPARRSPPCRFYGACGGCQLQHLTYEAQLEAKADFVRDALARIGRIEWPHKIEVRSAAEFGYRARAQVKVESAGPGAVRIGFNRAGSHAVCDIDSCPILTPELNAALAALRPALQQAGEIREVEMGAGENGVAVEPALPGMPGGPLERVVAGAAYQFSPSTFFQINALLFEDLVAEALGDETGELAIDLYAGVGLFTAQLARRFERVIGVEADPRAASFARVNLAANKATNVEFHQERAESWLKGYAARQKRTQSPAPDLALLDPPRGGAPEVVSLLAELRPPRIRYVSCDPATLARDLRGLLDSGYELTAVMAFDLFPQTYHVETVAALRLRE
ncbi:MAG TPA: class I SAM-dependent RNA methyltransferase [Blastocatellia bacterium]|nr:class I SAM-dependent RNA methyltransferase [Blastocatellia bacterium]